MLHLNELAGDANLNALLDLVCATCMDDLKLVLFNDQLVISVIVGWQRLVAAAHEHHDKLEAAGMRFARAVVKRVAEEFHNGSSRYEKKLRVFFGIELAIMHLTAFADHHDNIGEENVHFTALMKFNRSQSVGVAGTFACFNWQASVDIAPNLLDDGNPFHVGI